MAKKKQDRPQHYSGDIPDLWMTREQLSLLFDRSTVYLDRVLPKVTRGDRNEDKPPFLFRVTAVVKALFPKRGTKPDSDEADPLLAGPGSPNLELYRKHKARLAELDVAIREGELMPVAAVDEAIESALGRVRKAAESFCGECQKKYVAATSK